jgi:glycerol-3-phosphate acyltransferase PlsY
MDIWRSLGVLFLSYLMGAVPFGYILVMWRTGTDIRGVQSGRTGGTNAMRAAGVATGLGTGVLDVLKGFFAVSLARALVPGNEWIIALAPVAAILGHNYSISLIQVDKDGKLRFGGGAGGGTLLGGAMGLWLPSLYIMLPLGILIYYFVGYASITTTSAGVMALIIFGVRAYLGLSPWEYVLFGVLGAILVAIALRPNYRALQAGTERLHGFRARGQKKERAVN